MSNLTFKELQKKLKKTAKKLAKNSEKIETEAAEMSAELIQSRTKKGFGVQKDGAPKEKLKDLSPDYIAQRKREGLTGKSRLGRTDEMLDNVTSKKGLVFIKGKRNQDIAGFAEDTGRPFMHLSSPEKKKVIKMLREKVRDFFKKNG